MCNVHYPSKYTGDITLMLMITAAYQIFFKSEIIVKYDKTETMIIFSMTWLTTVCNFKQSSEPLYRSCVQRLTITRNCSVCDNQDVSNIALFQTFTFASLFNLFITFSQSALFQIQTDMCICHNIIKVLVQVLSVSNTFRYILQSNTKDSGPKS